MSIKDQTILAAFGQLNRNDDLRIITKIISDGSQIFVRKESYTIKAKSHIDKLKISHNKLNKAISHIDNISLVNILRSGEGFVDFEYIIGCNAEYKAFTSIISGDYNDAINIIDRIFNIIDLLPSERDSNEIKTVEGINNIYSSSPNVKYINPGIVDLNLDNFIINKNDQLVAFDYEWVFDQPIATDFIKTRLLYTFFARRSEAFAFLPNNTKPFKAILTNDTQTFIPAQLYTKYAQYFSKDSMKKYWEAEDIFQKSVDKYHQNTASSSYVSFAIKEITATQLTYPEVEEFNKNNYNEHIKELEEHAKNLLDEINIMKSSNSYRFVKKLQSIKNIITKK